MTREGACMHKALLVVKVSREEISVRLQHCSDWWENVKLNQFECFLIRL